MTYVELLLAAAFAIGVFLVAKLVSDLIGVQKRLSTNKRTDNVPLRDKDRGRRPAVPSARPNFRVFMGCRYSVAGDNHCSMPPCLSVDAQHLLQMKNVYPTGTSPPT